MNPDFRADLHCHTTCSDGTVTPEDLIQLACKRQLQGLAITDHDTIDAYRTAVPAAQTSGIALLSGIGLSAMHLQTSIHILAYSFPLDSPLIQEFCRRHNQRRAARHHAMLALLAAHGIPLSPEDFPYAASIILLDDPILLWQCYKRAMSHQFNKRFMNILGKEKSVMPPEKFLV